MTPNTRKELALMVPDGGILIELGVAAGNFAAELLATNPAIKYIGIDRWNDHHDTEEMATAFDKLRPFSNAALNRGTFAEMVPLIPSGYADLVYIDGYAHTGQERGETLRDWWPKLKPGGIFAGHDYCAEYQPTIDAVDLFVAEHGLKLNIIQDGKHPSWWVKKQG